MKIVFGVVAEIAESGLPTVPEQMPWRDVLSRAGAYQSTGRFPDWGSLRDALAGEPRASPKELLGLVQGLAVSVLPQPDDACIETWHAVPALELDPMAFPEGGHTVRGGRFRDRPELDPAPSHRSFETQPASDVGFRCVRDVPSPAE